MCDRYIIGRTPNERFGASGAVTRLKVCVDLQVLRPSERQWKPRLRQAANTLSEYGVVRIVNQTNTTEMTISHNLLFGKIQQIFEYIGVYEKFFDICSVIKKT
jgi:hypothetical protein